MGDDLCLVLCLNFSGRLFLISHGPFEKGVDKLGFAVLHCPIPCKLNHCSEDKVCMQAHEMRDVSPEPGVTHPAQGSTCCSKEL